MSYYLIPTSTIESWYEQTAILDGVEFRMRFSWSERERHWFFDLWTADGTEVMLGKKIVASAILTRRLTTPLRPLGELVVVDLSDSDTDPDLRDLGDRCVLVYIDQSEF